MAIIAACAAVFVGDGATGGNIGTGGGTGISRDLALYAPFLEVRGEWYRAFSSAFVHSGFMHIGFNMYLLWILGQSLEQRFGKLAFASMYVAGILGGSLGAMIVEPRASVVGASGAVFALMGVFVILQGSRGLGTLANGIGPLVAINIVLSFSGGISLGGHFGGLAVGLIMGAMITAAQRLGRRYEALLPIGFAALALAAFVALVPAVSRASNMAGF